MFEVEGKGRFVKYGQEGRALSDADFALFSAENIGFFEIYGVFARIRGGRTSIFREFVQTSVYGRGP